jgi:hypothetical protein
VTASMAWPSFCFDEKCRSLIRWQHRLQREHPTCTERKSLNEECGWKGGGSGSSAERKNLVQREKQKTIDLTPTGLLMEGDFILYGLSPEVVQREVHCHAGRITCAHGSITLLRPAA